MVKTNYIPFLVVRTISTANNQITKKDTPATGTDVKLVSAHHQSAFEINTSIQPDKELHVLDQFFGPSTEESKLIKTHCTRTRSFLNYVTD